MKSDLRGLTIPEKESVLKMVNTGVEYIESSAKNETSQLVESFDNCLLSYLKERNPKLKLRREPVVGSSVNILSAHQQTVQAEEKDYSELVQKRPDEESGGCNLI